MPAIYHEGSWLGNATDPEVLVKDTVGWTGKNLLKINMLQSPYTYNGITFTKNSDGSISVSGTSTFATAINIAYFDVESNVKYILTGTPDDIVNPTNNYIRAHREETTYIWQVQDNGNGAVIQRTNSERIWIDIRIASGVTINTTFYPMLRKADIIDPTYEPYHESVEEEIEQIYADNGVLGAKNLVLNASSSGTYNGITFTKNNDGSVTVNGTATALVWKTVCSIKLPVGKYILNGCPPGGDAGPATYCIALWNTDGGTAGSIINVRDAGEGVIVDITQELTYLVSVGIAKNQTVNNLTFKPMLRLASDPDDTYQPYAMTNRELTPQIVYNQNNICVCKQGKIVIAQFNGAKPSDIAALNFANMGAKPAFYVNTFQCRCDAKPTTIEINANGTVVNVGYYASYGATYTDLKSDSSKSVNGSICFIAE